MSTVKVEHDGTDQMLTGIWDGKLVEVRLWVSEIDGKPVVQVDTPDWPDTIETGPDIRVFVNDGQVYGEVAER